VTDPACAVPFQGCLPGHPAPSHIPSGAILVWFSPHLLRAPVFIFRKIILYGKSKRLTHGPYKLMKLRCRFPQLVRVSPPDPTKASANRLFPPARPGGCRIGLQGRCKRQGLARASAWNGEGIYAVCSYYGYSIPSYPILLGPARLLFPFTNTTFLLGSP
jgi:hypothetical protein